jgi:adenosine deaminase
MPNILITTLGQTWQIVPELLGFTNPEQVDFYLGHPGRDALLEARCRSHILTVDELWLITTRGESTDKALAETERWLCGLPEDARPSLHIRKTADIEDPGTENECRYMAECIFRLVLHCCERAGDGQLLISLAGGRKTMSADMQNAAMFFGCHALLHVIQSDHGITPLVIGRFKRNPLLDLDGHDRAAVTARRFPITGKGEAISVKDFSLTHEIWTRQKTAGFLYCNHTNRLMHLEKTSNFLALYNLEPSMINQLKECRIGVKPENEASELAWLGKLPKAELHCHLGGIADAREMIEIAAANSDRIDEYREALSKKCVEWKRRVDAGLMMPAHFKSLRTEVPGVPEPLSVAAFILLFEDDPDGLDELVFGPYRNAGAFCGIDFSAYETLGDLQGSGLLQSEESLRAACRILLRKAQEHHVKHLEVRCSPVNYNQGGLEPRRVADIIGEELSLPRGPSISLIFTASRHGKMSKVHEHIELARELMGEDGTGFPQFQGFDLAGDEKAGHPADMRQAFMAMMEKCMHFTIHAGETDSVERIWEAVYHLNAERVGHGLTLLDNPRLMARFRDRKITVEMCPSSNFQIVGFHDAFLTKSKRMKTYPLKRYLDEGLRVTVNTDNPGISRTDFTRELHRAARMSPGGLSLWEILLLIRNSFRAAFVGSDMRHELLRQAESEVIEQIREGLSL